MSITINSKLLKRCSENLDNLSTQIKKVKDIDEQRLQSEYQRLVDGLKKAQITRETDIVLSNPILPRDILDEAIPGNIRKAEHFIIFMKRFLEYINSA